MQQPKKAHHTRPQGVLPIQLNDLCLTDTPLLPLPIPFPSRPSPSVVASKQSGVGVVPEARPNEGIPSYMMYRPSPSPKEYWRSTNAQAWSLPPPPAPRIPYASLPPVHHPDPHLNPILVPRQGLVYDVRESPFSARVVSAELMGRWNDQAATVPSVTVMTIACARFEDPIVVLPMIATSRKVTVLDVLFAIHKRVHRVPNDPSTFSLLEPIGHRGRGIGAPRGDAIEARDASGSGSVGANAVAGASGSGSRRHVDGRRGVFMVEGGWDWVGILPSAVEPGVWILELR